MAKYVAGGGFFLPADMGALEAEFRSWDYRGWEQATGFFTKTTGGTKIEYITRNNVADIKLAPNATAWYTEITTQVSSNEITVIYKHYGENNTNTHNIKLLFKGAFDVVSGVAMGGTVKEIQETVEQFGNINQNRVNTLSEVSIDYSDLLNYFGKPAGDISGQLFGSNDTISANSGGNGIVDFKLRGFGGNDQIVGSDRSDWISGDEGDDNLQGNSGNDILIGGDGKDWLHGNAGIDRLFGNSGDDEIIGGMGRDRIWGGSGKDRVNGGLDDDWLSGGLDADVFVLSQGNDIIEDFNPGTGDQIALDLKQAYSFQPQGRDLKLVHAGGTALLLGINQDAFKNGQNLISI